MTKKLTALLLALAMMLSLLTGCGDASAPAAEGEEEPTDSSQDAPADEGEADTDTDTDAEALPAEIPAEVYEDVVSYLTDGALTKDTVVITANGQEVTADEYFNWLATCYSNMAYTYYYYGMTLDLTEVLDEAGTTVADYFANQAAMLAQMYTVVSQKAAEANVGLTEEQQSQLDNIGDVYNEDSILYYGTTMEAMGRVYANSTLVLNMQDHLYGEGGELEPTEATMADYAAENGYYNCRYILQRTDELEESDTEGKAAKLQQAESLYNELKELSGQKLIDRFIELQVEYNDDGNASEYPFDNTASLVTGFREKVAELEEGQVGLSDETDYGYFVILRLPVDQETVKDSYISDAYNTLITGWMEESELETSEAIVNMDAEAVIQKLIDLQVMVNNKVTADAEAAEAEAAEGETADAEG